MYVVPPSRSGVNWVGSSTFNNASMPIKLVSNLYFWLPRLVRCFCQKLSGLMICAVWIWAEKYSWSTFKIGFTEFQVEVPRISTMTVKPSALTSSLKFKKKSIIIIMLKRASYHIYLVIYQCSVLFIYDFTVQTLKTMFLKSNLS